MAGGEYAKQHAGVNNPAYDARWHDIWDAGLEPGQGFDASRASPALCSYLDGGAAVKGKRVLVPGCGRGYDLVEFAKRGAAESVGLELTTSGAAAAKTYIRGCGLPEDLEATIRVENGNFFGYCDRTGKFDVGYDYTFLCALQPCMRTTWATGWAAQLAAGSELITLMFPIMPEPLGDQGPPFPLTCKLYDDLLLPAGFSKLDVSPVPSHLSHKGREEKEWLGRWRRD